MKLNTYFNSVIKVSFLATCLASETKKKPNVMIILADDVGTGDLPGYWEGSSKVNMPNVQNLVANGTTFTDAHSTPLCAPSRYVLLSGNYQHRGSFFGGTWGMNYVRGSQFRYGQQSMADVFRDNGYNTAMFGKWHIGGKIPLKDNYDRPTDNKAIISKVNALSHESHDWKRRMQQGPQNVGFRHTYITVGGIQAAPYAFLRNDKFDKKDLQNITFWQKGKYRMPEGRSKIPQDGEGASDWDSTAYNMVVVKETEKFIKTHVRNKPEEPFFAYVALGSVHTPHSPPIRYLDGSRVAGTYDWGHMDLLSELDKIVGSLTKMLEDRNLIEDTIILFSSDNGGIGNRSRSNRRGHLSSGPLRDQKGSIYEGGHRVPLTIRWDNGKIPKGERRSHVVGLNDVFKTLTDLAGLEVPQGQAMDSVSFSDYALNQNQKQGLRKELGVWKYDKGKPKAASIRNGNLKLIYNYENNAAELYDLSADISETHDISTEKKWMTRDMIQKLREISPCHDTVGEFDVYHKLHNVTRKRDCEWFRQERKTRCGWFHEGLSHCELTCRGEIECTPFRKLKYANLLS